MIVRAFWKAVKVESAAPPYDTIHLKVLYPAQMSGSQQERNFGIVPADSDLAPFPVVIFFGGVNCSPEVYQWLAVEVARRGFVVITFAWVAENIPGAIALTPGVDLAMLAPNTYGTGPSASALPALLAELEKLQTQGILAGMLDLKRIILGGHSAGGRVALESADPRFFPQVAGAFAYGAHTSAPIITGFPPDTILPLPSALPMLLMGGTCDGVIAASSDRYGISTGDPTRSIIRTFQEAIVGGRNEAYLLLLEGANHFSITYPSDITLGTSLLDFPATQPEEEIRSLISKITGLFLDAHIKQKPEALEMLNSLLNQSQPLINCFQRK